MDDSHYFQLPEAGSEEPKYRERVYCYELYHQLRNVLESKLSDFPYKLDAEVDKAGHRIIEERMKPDFIVHVPGEMNSNLAVIEVKPLKQQISRLKDELEYDIDKLKTFLEEFRYHRAIMLIYGDGKQELPSAIVAEAESLVGDYEGRILLVWHRGPGKEPVEVW